MSDNHPKIQDSNHRVCNRIHLSRKLLFELDSGEILEGRSADLSPRGALMITEFKPDPDLLGVAGMLFMISDEGAFSIGYPCKAVRLGDRSIALEVHKKAAAAFGNYVTEELLKR